MRSNFYKEILMVRYVFSFIVMSLMLLNVPAHAEYLSDEALYKKAVGIEEAVKLMELHLKKLSIELTIMSDVYHGSPTRFPASRIPNNDKGKPVVVIPKFRASMTKFPKRTIKSKMNDHKDEMNERKKTLTRLKKEREEIFRLIQYRVRGMR
jgi:hypothetical protein